LFFNAGFLYIALANIQAAFFRTRRAEKEVTELNEDLIAAYDTTLEGWAKALELKDKETEGHSRRVTGMTIQLAQKFGFSNDEIRQIYYGALLHDIGKMGIPDEILNKPGPLSREEWLLVQQHPITAFHLLKPIDYLEKAVEIPYCHHEKWNGTGYPNRLQGEEIPVAARIFAVVDVWDALTSDRPYRKAWPQEKVMAYIKKEAGQHFDPHIVKVFCTEVIKDN
jgi:HD-GYP domain-containing protein (c-di-GMP phosphodiesterase class II)